MAWGSYQQHYVFCIVDRERIGSIVALYKLFFFFMIIFPSLNFYLLFLLRCVSLSVFRTVRLSQLVKNETSQNVPSFFKY